jgi:hypothetical protein
MFRYRFFIFIIILLALASCNKLEQKVTVDLPEFQSQLVVECYIQNDTPVIASITETQDLYSPPTRNPFVSGAIVTLSYDDKIDTFKPNLLPDFRNVKYYNYIIPKILNPKPGTNFSLYVKDSKGREARAESKWLEAVKIDSVDYRFREDSMAYLVVYFKDDGSTKDFYRFRIKNTSDTSNNGRSQDRRDFAFEDGIFNGTTIPQGTGYNFKKGDRLEIYLYHITEDFYEFTRTMRAAENANGNPFAQPAVIKSNMVGGIGVLGILPYDKKIITIK